MGSLLIYGRDTCYLSVLARVSFPVYPMDWQLELSKLVVTDDNGLNSYLLSPSEIQGAMAAQVGFCGSGLATDREQHGQLSGDIGLLLLATSRPTWDWRPVGRLHLMPNEGHRRQKQRRATSPNLVAASSGTTQLKRWSNVGIQDRPSSQLW
ncbi:hypothetical protein LTR08_008599 [Meristemomyces frigidus]|nr:hypothetical protein LTR08_008599 [Meristemomyces frigidus]